jgi:p-aminobenzoyl-glutamate transporter AbgT
VRRRLDPAALPFDTTADVPPLHAGIGTVIALMIPYTLVLTVAWVLFFIAWYALGIPVGPGGPIR